MYIEKTTAGDRLTIRAAVDGSFTYISRARRLLMKLLNDHFEDREQKSISRADAEDVGDVLMAINDALWWAETEYALTIGDEDAPGCHSSYQGAQRAILVRDVERLRDKVGTENTKPYLDMDDEEALPILQKIADRKGGETR